MNNVTDFHAYHDPKYFNKLSKGKYIDWKGIAKELLSRYYTSEEQQTIINGYTYPRT